jgi:hypothetical protein
MTVLTALSTIAIDQTKVTETTMGQCLQLPDHLSSNQEAKVRFHASDMIIVYTPMHHTFPKKGSAKLHLQTFFHGLDAPKRGANKIEWRIPH